MLCGRGRVLKNLTFACRGEALPSILEELVTVFSGSSLTSISSFGSNISKQFPSPSQLLILVLSPLLCWHSFLCSCMANQIRELIQLKMINCGFWILCGSLKIYQAAIKRSIFCFYCYYYKSKRKSSVPSLIGGLQSINHDIFFKFIISWHWKKSWKMHPPTSVSCDQSPCLSICEVVILQEYSSAGARVKQKTRCCEICPAGGEENLRSCESLP